MRLSFTLRPDGEAVVDIEADSTDVRHLTEMGVQHWGWMVQSMVNGRYEQAEEVRNEGRNGLPATAGESFAGDSGDSIHTGYGATSPGAG